MKLPTVLVVFGGESSEHDVSVNSAKNISKAIDESKYNQLLCYIDLEGKWWLLDKWTDDPDAARTVQLSVTPGVAELRTIPGNETIPVDVMFPVLHGKMGEDGAIQGLIEMAHIPYVGCGIEASAVCMNKDAAKQLLEPHGIPVVPWLTIRKGESSKSFIKRIHGLHGAGPWFVKPSRAGSSVGVSKVTDKEDLPAAVALALSHDDLVLVEIAIQGRELEVAVLGNPPHHKASGVGEIVPGGEFYDYEDKYAADSKSITLTDAHLPKALDKVIRQHALDAYDLLGCKGLARVDFMLSDDLIPYMNEVNTLPGFTDISMYPKLWQQKNISQVELVDRLIALALE